MDTFRLILFFAFFYTGFLIWQAWQEDYGQPSPGIESNSAKQIPVNDAVPQAPQSNQDQPALHSAHSEWIEVKTDRLAVKIDTQGGTLSKALLLDYPISIDDPEQKYSLLDYSPNNFFIIQNGLISAQPEQAPTHQARFQAAKKQYVLSQGQDQLKVDLNWTSPQGITVIKRYIFHRGSHVIELQHIVKNESQTTWQGREYRQIQRGAPNKRQMMAVFIGGVAWDPEDKYQKYDFDDLAKGALNKDVLGGWIAMMQHYFLAAILPPADQKQHFYSKQLSNGHYVIGAYGPAVSVPSGQTQQFDGRIYVGAKEQAVLSQLAPSLDLVVDYGWLTLVAKPMYQILSWINSIVGNWGWTIIIFTILIKGLFFKLSESGYRSMAKMRNLTPRIQALKDRYGEDKQRLQMAMMELYKKEKINPVGGCLPMLIQMPFFIALYWVLMESVELRQAPWILWIRDLSEKDPYFVLPVIMGLTMYIQQKLNPAPPDPMQEKIMLALPFVFTIMFAFFPSGLVLYWTANNILSMAQQWLINKRMEEGKG